MKMVPLGELMPPKSGTLNPTKHRDEVFELYSIPAFDRGYPDVLSGSEIGSSKQLVYPGDVLVSKIVPHIRRAMIVPVAKNRIQLASSEWIVFRDQRVHPPYLAQYLTSDPFHRQFMNTVAGVGGSLLRARPQQVKSIRAPLPPLNEQRRIAAILDKADAVRQKRRQALAYLDTLTQAIFHDLFNTSEHWTTVGDLAESTQYGSSSKASAEGNWPVLRMGNITYEGRLTLDNLKYFDLPEKEVSKFTVKKGDLLFNRTNSAELVGKTCIVDTDRPLAFAGYLIRVRFPRPETATIVSGYLNSPHGKLTLRSMAKSIVGQANINAKELRSIRVPSVSTAEELHFSKAISSIRAREANFQTGLTSANALFNSLQSRAFRGEL